MNNVIKLGEQLINLKQTITSAESLTAGLFLSALGNVPGISAVLPGGFVTYSAETKASMVDVPLDLIADKGVVSAEVAKAMASGAQTKLDTSWAISFTGVAGPGPADGQPAGTVFIGIAQPNHSVMSRKFSFTGDRQAVREQAIEAAAEWLLATLEINN
ncbi:nicotinamide-nucleotide amidohydrolase family protein [Weissella ceti]|uniref:Nicotinamide-nucleotide amidohydrolase family protein n=1 Tax=Weissella ceti TaxID=759620 RepID=A0ABT3E3Z8_9LACO|nr:nicotinamide-nucleotide amidohydrolase family protein [Weissella ceti]MCW0953080.1 nicotinamide-nucleotide amidohydrolase family protein [Weissella ceti]QVK11623.1 nicotinamide-nucleotide amidohydrolase family protein [Weissella ceti]